MARGAGSGLSGGALPVKDGVLIVLTRMKRILEIDLDNGRVCVEPGRDQRERQSAAVGPGVLLSARPVVADRVLDRRQRGRELRRRALLQVRLHDQLRHRAGARARRRGAGARSAATSSTRPATTCSARSSAPRARLGVATKIWLRVVPSPGDGARRSSPSSTPRTPRARRCREIVQGGVVPGAIEMMDARAIEASEQMAHAGLPGRPGRRAAGGARRLPARVRGALRRGGRRSASAAAPTTCAWPATRPSARCSGRPARPRSPRWAASPPTTSSRTA